MRVLVVDDEPLAREVAHQAVVSLGHECRVAGAGDEAWDCFQTFLPEVVISDWSMPGLTGLDLCRRVRAFSRETYTYFILVTVRERGTGLDEALAAGIDDFLSKPLDSAELRARLTVAERIANLQLQVQLASERVSTLEEQMRSRCSFEGMVGKSAAMQEVYRRVRLAARSDASVLLSGESGTGKEMAARAIHGLSGRVGGPLFTVNCAALPSSVLESELFGHVKGAFTGAVRGRVGLFQMADGGTLFLDEIGDISPSVQVKLLRVLQEREFFPVGSDRPARTDFRLITATNKDLARLLRDRLFREDLYYRIRVFQIELPPLRQRREDIPLIAEHYLRQFARECRSKVEGFYPEALDVMLNYAWPGNVRELRNAVEHAFVIGPEGKIGAEDLPEELSLRSREKLRSSKQRRDAAVSSIAIFEALRVTAGNRTEAARMLGISRVALWKRIRRLGIQASLPATGS